MANAVVIGPIVWIGAVVVVGALVAFVVAARRARRKGDPSPIVSVTLTISAFWAALSLLGAAITTLSILQPDFTVTVPVREFWPQLPDGTQIDGPTAEIVGGGFTSAELRASGLSSSVRVTWAIGQALTALIPGTIAALIAVACFQLLAGRAFAPVVSRAAAATAAVVAVGGVAAEVLNDIAGNLAASELLGLSGGRYKEVAGIEDVFAAWLPQPGFGIEFPLWPIAAGLAFTALAAIFRYGSRLQRDTEGLV